MSDPQDDPKIKLKLPAQVRLDLTTGALPGSKDLQVPDISKLFEEEQITLDSEKQEGIRKLKLENDILQAQHDKIKSDNTARKNLGIGIFVLVFIWLICVIVIMFLTGGKILAFSDSVLIALLTTSSVNVIGILVIVANYLFNKDKST